MGSSGTAWFLTRKAVIAGMVIAGPIALPLLWLSPGFTGKAKFWMTAAAITIAIALWPVTRWSFVFLRQQLTLVYG